MTTLGMNAAFAAGTNLLGIRNDPYMDFNFFHRYVYFLNSNYSSLGTIIR